MRATDAAIRFAEGLTEKFTGDEHPETYCATAGTVRDKIMRIYRNGGGSVHAFVDRGTGHVHKAEGLHKASKRAAYPDVESALAAADPYGGYLYANAAPGVPGVPGA